MVTLKQHLVSIAFPPPPPILILRFSSFRFRSINRFVIVRRTHNRGTQCRIDAEIEQQRQIGGIDQYREDSSWKSRRER